MKVNTADIQTAISNAEQLLQNDASLPDGTRAAFTLLVTMVKLMAAQLNLNSRNSSKPPASDPLREKKPRATRGRKPGGQPGQPGTTLKPVAAPDEVLPLLIDQRTLPRGHRYQLAGWESRQVIDIRIQRHVTEYRAQILANEKGERFVAGFPEGVTRPVQYGASVKANAVYLSMQQLIPYERVQAQFDEQFSVPLSTGSLCNFNREAWERLTEFERLAKAQLRTESALHVDETGINVGGKRIWLHNTSSARWTLYVPHAKRGTDALDAIGILPHYRGTLIHDHWKAYYRYACTHALCNAHHLRELTHAHEVEGQAWARAMITLLTDMSDAVNAAGGALPVNEAKAWRKKYRRLLKKAEQECPPPDLPKEGARRGRIKRSKSRNLLERLGDYEDDVLRFLENVDVPFTNNQGERDIRMTKVQQKISGCFRSFEGAEIFCRIRSYLSTCRKQGVGAGDALECLFNGKWPEFIQTIIDRKIECAE